MKNKTLKILLIIACILLIVIPITVYAVPNIIEYITVVSDNGNVKQELLEEKEQYTNMIQNQPNNYMIDEDKELTNKLEQNDEANKAKEEIIASVLNKFYPEKYAELREKIEEKDIDSSNHDVSPKSPEMEFYNLVLDVIEKENLTEEEKSVLKEFMINQYSNAKGNDKVQSRIEDICM